ncbi:MAG: O-methyltransferase [Lachnospiraceae bacterium]|nr:O-methyltransferase [Lachnospiraceae bacterium]
MVMEERIATYIHSLDTGNSEFVNRLRRQAQAEEIPIIRQEAEPLLKVLIQLRQPKQILEVGTAVGYSALLMSEVMPKDCRITTIEKYEKRIPAAKENFRLAGKDQVITLLEGDAAEILERLEGSYDLIFMDAAKGQYIHFLPAVMRLLSFGGVLVSDNVLQDGDIIESRYCIARRNRTIHARMREYLYELTHREDLETSILPIGDGMTVSVKKRIGEKKG